MSTSRQMPIGRKKVSTTNSGYKYKLLHRLERLMIVVFALVGPQGNEISSICTLTFHGEKRARQIIIILQLFLSSPLVFCNNFHIKSHHFKMICTHVNSYLWKRGRRRTSCHISHSIPFLASVVVVLLLLIKKRCVTNGLENFSSRFFSRFFI